MIGYYKKQILKLGIQLIELHANLDNLQLLLSLQFQILHRILHTEVKLSEYRNRRQTLVKGIKAGRLPKESAARLKQKLSAIEFKLNRYQWMLFVWRCFGDGIAFAYLDKWAMKSLLYNTDNPEAKQMAGHITGKEGLEGEIALLQDVVSRGIPALLTDLTNSIRHGDVCLLSGPDPQLIEVKSSRNTNRRVARQAKNLSSIHNYLALDEAFNLRGFPHMQRVGISLPERNYLDRLDDAISAALRKGLFVSDLEPGTRLVVISDKRKEDVKEIFAGLERVRVYLLNDARNEAAWGCYYPFTLSLKEPQHLYAFLHGDVYVIVAFDLARVQSRASELGLTFSEVSGGEWSFQFERQLPGSIEPAISKLSSHFANRMAFELISWEWVFEWQRILLDEVRQEYQ